ncbi:MAG: TonB-dependent siderophore receptor [Rhizobacter sp.]
MSAQSARRRVSPFARSSTPRPSSLALACALAVLAWPAHAQQAPAAAEPAASAPAAAAPGVAPAASAPAPAAAASPATGEATLPAVKVKATRTLDASTEGTGSYAPGAMTLGKGQRSQREIANSTTVVTREQLTEQNITTIESALKNVTGVTVQRFDATGNYTQFIARGYAADSYLLDGLTVQTDTNGIYFDLYAYDRVEVQRGAASLFSGAGEPGITVNMARKRALAGFKGEASISTSSWDDHRVQADLTGALNTTGTLRGRVAVVAQEYDTFMDGIDDNSKRMVYGTLEADITDHTTLSVGATWQKVDTVLSRGLPTWAGGRLIEMRRETMPVQEWTRQQLDSKTVFAELEHRMADDASIKVSLRHLKRGNNAKYLDPSPPVMTPGPTYGDMTATTAAAFEREDTDDTLDVYYTQPFTLGSRKHDLLVGADYRRSQNDTRYSSFSTPVAGTLNLFRYDGDAIPEPVFNLDNDISHVQVKSYGVYSQLRLRPFEDWTLIGGGRLSSYESTGLSFGARTNFANKNEFTPYAAAIYDAAKWLSFYGSYNEIFKPQNSFGPEPAREQLPPRTGRAFELGAKGEAFGGQLAWSTAIYRVTDENRALGVTPPAPALGYSVPAGKARAQGFEFDARGEINSRWSVSGGYAYNDSRILSGTGAQQGTPLSTFTSRHSGNLWTRYKIGSEGGPLQGASLGAGARSVSHFYNGSGASRVDAGGYTIYNAYGAYPINENLTVSLNIDNLFDKVYWEKVSGPSRQNFWGEPRRVTLTLRGTF